MIVYRLSNTRYASDLKGEGARLNGGRWNHVGIPCLYTSASRALAVLEFSANVGTHSILRYLSIVTIEIPDDIETIEIAKLPGNWKDAPAPLSTKDFGTAWLNAGEHAALKMPSVVIPEEFNYLVNPGHPLASSCRVKEIKDFIYDIRIKSI